MKMYPMPYAFRSNWKICSFWVQVCFTLFFYQDPFGVGIFIGYVDLKNIFASQTDKIKKYALT